MQIPKELPQFEKQPALFVASGEYEARFYLARNGKLELEQTLKMPPREEAREKQAFVGIKGGRYGLAAVSHRGAYVKDLKNRFHKKFHAIVRELFARYKLGEVYIFAPRYVASRIVKNLEKQEQKNVKIQAYQEDTKINPLALIQKFWEKEQETVKPEIVPHGAVRRILQQPRIRCC